MRAAKAPYRSFSVKYNEETRHTHLALLASDGHLFVFENEEPENLSEFTPVDDFSVCAKPKRGEEVSFKVRFDPNPDPCYTALRAGVASESLSLVTAGMATVKIYRSREVESTTYLTGEQSKKDFYLAIEIQGHRGLVRDIAWAPGNIRGYDIVATACQDGYVRVFRIDTPFSADDGKSWSTADVARREPQGTGSHATPSRGNYGEKGSHATTQSGLTASLAKSSSNGERQPSGQPGQVKHTAREIARLDSHRTPVWRVGFDDDGQILGSVGDDGKLMCYRQTPSGSWAKSSEIAMMKKKMVAP
jgi:nucleoporin SEH1